MQRLLVSTVISLLLILALESSGCSRVPASPPVTPERSGAISIIALGDSITSGTASPYGFTHFLPIWKEVVVHNQGVPSDTTGKMLARIDDALAVSADMVLIFGGTNDVYYRVPRADTMANIEKMVKRTREAKMQPVLVGPLPRNDVSTEELSNLRKAIESYARSTEVPFIDPWPAFDDPVHHGWIRPNLTSDGVHPNELGAALLASVVARGLEWSEPWDDPR